ncbi:MAG: type II toxin-antitoxin system MqsA family antitoxin [Clostridiales bacterium]|nr:type II toxin-antitoxin system MqsA family antitoxin [Clostridiales bacterium]
MKYCYECDNEKDFHFNESMRAFNVKGEKYDIKAQVAVCDHCGEEVYDPDLDPIYQEQAFDLYRKAHRLLSPGEITAIREKYGLAIDRFSELIGMGKKTLWRYENGYIPDKVYSNLIRFLENPDNFRNIFEAEKAMLRVDEVEKVKSALTHMNKLEREDCVMVSASLEWLPDNIIDFPQKDVVSTWNRGTRMEYDDEKQRA